LWSDLPWATLLAQPDPAAVFEQLLAARDWASRRRDAAAAAAAPPPQVTAWQWLCCGGGGAASQSCRRHHCHQRPVLSCFVRPVMNRVCSLRGWLVPGSQIPQPSTLLLK
jgi:hypothetical protein